MSNVLIDDLPDSVEIGGEVYPIYTDFRPALRVILAFEDPDLAEIEKHGILLANLYETVPNNYAEALRMGMKFLNCGETNSAEESGPRLYSFSQDARFIFSAFQQTHGIDLETADMHWWKFSALFMDLGSETTFCQMVSLRKRVLTGKATKEERQVYSEIRDIIELDQTGSKSLEDRELEAKFLNLVKEKKNGRHRSE
jgi:hypothetical protein